MGVRKNASNLATRAELGRIPLESSIFCQTILYFIRLYTKDLNPTLKESFLLTQNLDTSGVYTWFTFAKDIVGEIGLDIDQIKNFSNNKHL